MKPGKEAIIAQITTFAEQEIPKFLKAHPGLVFYAFALDCNVVYGEVNLCLNTLADFENSLASYQKNWPEEYSAEEEIFDLKYNTGDWEYQCFATTCFFSEEQINEIFASNSEDAWKFYLQICNEALQQLTATPAFQMIPKEAGFISYCIDHDEDVAEAVRKTNPSL
ncbi:DUF4303 domain-containing protein [Listeria costaricensis]|uniref:DUF4303 domain-containing protein n=1 Tax=Listeria costaricensis TaxID=2026604 RepID=UPI000C086288|nr:DUF4303 domain-containing protein [Listeria costaricensis]